MLHEAHLLSILPCPSLHGLIEHELHCRIEHQQQGRERAVPQCPDSLVSYDLKKSVLERVKKKTKKNTKLSIILINRMVSDHRSYNSQAFESNYRWI